MIKIKDAVVAIFDPKGKKKTKNTPEMMQSQSTLTAKQEGKAVTKKPAAGALPKVLLSKEEVFKQNPAAAIALLHYELNETALGVSNAKSTKSIKGNLTDLPVLHGYSLFCFGPTNNYRMACH
jgi:hypothetical protein